jgi:hypothetical protein
LETVRPIFFICCSRVFCSMGTQEPHWVPAVVQAFRDATSWLPSTMASRTVPKLMLLQEHRIGSSGSSVSGMPSPPPAAVR